MGIFKFNVLIYGNTIHLNLLEVFGMIKLDQVITHVRIYCVTSTIPAQNAYHIYEILINLHTAPAYKHLMEYLDQARVRRIKNGLTLFKIINYKFTIDARTTVTVIRKSLGSLDQYMATVDGNSKKSQNM